MRAAQVVGVQVVQRPHRFGRAHRIRITLPQLARAQHHRAPAQPRVLAQHLARGRVALGDQPARMVVVVVKAHGMAGGLCLGGRNTPQALGNALLGGVVGVGGPLRIRLIYIHALLATYQFNL